MKQIQVHECNQLVDNQLVVDLKKLCTIQINHKMNIIIRKTKIKNNIAFFLHGACFYPVNSVSVKAIQNNQVTTWHVLKPHLIKKHIPDKIATAKGHIYRQSQGLQSTTPIIPSLDGTTMNILRPILKAASTEQSLKDSNTVVINNNVLPNFLPSINNLVMSFTKLSNCLQKIWHRLTRQDNFRTNHEEVTST